MRCHTSRSAVVSALFAVLAVTTLPGCGEDDGTVTTPADASSKPDVGTETVSTLPTPAYEPSAVPTPADIAELRPEVPGVHDDVIVFGQSAALTGPAQALGQGMRLGILAAFHEANTDGGVNGRRLELESRDDAYEPVAALANTIELIEDDKVFALLGATGTPTSEVSAPTASIRGVPYIAPFTGAGLLRDDTMNRVINFRASYTQETESMVMHLKEDLGIERIGVMFQDDSFGREGYRGVVKALKEHNNTTPVSIGYYTRNTTTVKSALLDLKSGNPQAVIIIGTYAPTALMIRWAHKINFDPIFMTVSFIGADTLAAELGTAGEGVFITQVVPFPLETDTPASVAYRNALKAYDDANGTDSQPGFVSFEGYLAGRLAIEGLKLGGPGVTRQRFIDELLNADEINIEGLQLAFNKSDGKEQPLDNQGSDKVFLTVIDSQGKLRSVTTLNEATS